MSTIDKILKLLKEQNKKQKDLTDFLGITKNAFTDWKSGRIKSYQKHLPRIAEFLNVSVDYLLEKEEFNNSTPLSFNKEETELIKKYRKLDDIGKELINKSIEIELKRVDTPKVQQKIYHISYYDMPVSAGTGQYLDYTNCSVLSLKEKPPANADFVLSVSGDSMEPTFYDRDKVFVEETNTLNIGDIGIFYYDGDVYIKEYGKKGLISHNEKYKIIRGSENMRVLGRVIGTVEE